ncbi:hypothetical protein DRN98_05690 [Methanosarcinales archaeon]|nr:MAG: hypothetical protein DRN98_05690 [Methanosarcinales archaeon]
MSESASIFDKDAVELLLQTRNLLDEVLETMDIIADEKLMKKIAEAEMDVKDGRVRDFDEFLEELNAVQD